MTQYHDPIINMLPGDQNIPAFIPLHVSDSQSIHATRTDRRPATVKVR